jgi:hypothetical protein
MELARAAHNNTIYVPFGLFFFLFLLNAYIEYNCCCLAVDTTVLSSFSSKTLLSLRLSRHDLSISTTSICDGKLALTVDDFKVRGRYPSRGREAAKVMGPAYRHVNKQLPSKSASAAHCWLPYMHVVSETKSL